MKRHLLYFLMVLGLVPLAHGQGQPAPVPYGGTFLIGSNIFFNSTTTNGMTNFFNYTNINFYDLQGILRSSFNATNQVPFVTNSAGGFPYLGGLNVALTLTNYQNLVSSNANGQAWRDVQVPFDVNGNVQSLGVAVGLVGTNATSTNWFQFVLQRGVKIPNPFGTVPTYQFTTEPQDQWTFFVTNNGTTFRMIQTNAPANWLNGTHALRLSQVNSGTLSSAASGGWGSYVEVLQLNGTSP